MRSCKTCQFAVESKDGTILCRRYAPQAFVADADSREAAYEMLGKNIAPSIAAAWPAVNKNDWCGEYKSKADR